MEWVFFAVVWDVKKHNATSSTIDGSIQVLLWQSDLERACRTPGPWGWSCYSTCNLVITGFWKWPLECIFTEADGRTVFGQERQTSEGTGWGIAGSRKLMTTQERTRNKIPSWESGSINCSNRFNTFVLSYELCFTENMPANNYITQLCTVVGKWKDVEYPNINQSINQTGVPLHVVTFYRMPPHLFFCLFLATSLVLVKNAMLMIYWQITQVLVRQDSTFEEAPHLCTLRV